MIPIDTLIVCITSPDGANVPAKVDKCDNGSADVSYHPIVDGQHVITITRKNGVPIVFLT